MRLILLAEALVFALAAATHSGWTVSGYEHARAATAETVIAAILLVGFALSLLLPAHWRRIGLVAQGLALAGTLIGVLVVIIGIGPRTVPDVIYHALMLSLLISGLVRFWTLSDSGL